MHQNTKYGLFQGCLQTLRCQVVVLVVNNSKQFNNRRPCSGTSNAVKNLTLLYSAISPLALVSPFLKKYLVFRVNMFTLKISEHDVMVKLTKSNCWHY